MYLWDMRVKPPCTGSRVDGARFEMGARQHDCHDMALMAGGALASGAPPKKIFLAQLWFTLPLHVCIRRKKKYKIAKVEWETAQDTVNSHLREISKKTIT